jgi:hypothetical protein
MKHKHFYYTLIILIILSLFNVSASATRKDVKYHNLFNWAVKNGATFKKFQIKYLFGNNRYIVAQDDIKKGENIATVPNNLIFTDQNPLIKPTCDKYQLTDQECISVYICEELKNKNGFFYHYFQFLPYDFDTYPLFYKNKQWDMIKGSMIGKKVNDWKAYFQTEHAKLKVNH